MIYGRVLHNQVSVVCFLKMNPTVALFVRILVLGNNQCSQAYAIVWYYPLF
jgi:hypothetical protein